MDNNGTYGNSNIPTSGAVRKVALYIRVSTQEQAAHGYSVGEQESRLRKYCEAHDWKIVQVYKDPGFSGAYLDRPGIQQLIRDTALGIFDTVLVWKLDRLSRSQKNTMYLIEDVFLKKGISFISMNENFDTNTPFGRAMVGILSVFAQLDRDQITQRMNMGRLGRAKAGYYSGGSRAPIGYTYRRAEGDEKKTLEIDQYEAMQVRMIYDLFLHGMDGQELSLADIKRYMHSHYTTRYGSWTSNGQISRVLTTPIYTGMVSFGGKWFPGVHEPIISQETFDAAQEKYKRYRDQFSGSIQHFKGAYMLTGMLRCGICGSRYFMCSYRHGEKRFYRYTCYGRKPVNPAMAKGKCKNRTYPKDELEGIVIDEIMKLKANPGSIQHQERPDETLGIRTRIADIDKQMGKLIDLYQLGAIAFPEIKKRSDSLKAEKDSLERELEQKKRPEGVVTEKDFRNILASFDAGAFKALSVERKRSVLRSLINSIVIYPDSIEIHWAFH